MKKTNLCLMVVLILTVQIHASTAALAQPRTELSAGALEGPAPLDQSGEATRIHTYLSRHNLSGGYGNWREAGVRGTHRTGSHVWQAEAATMRRFGESGAFASAGDTLTFNPEWYGSLSIGAGDGASYLPKYRVDSFLNRKFLDARNLVGTLGLAYYRAPDGHTDRSLGLGATYYFNLPLVVQGEVRVNSSNPGHVRTTRQFLAAIWGREKETQVIGRHAWGAEGYQAIGGGNTLVNFRSRETSIAVRHLLGPDWGVTVQVDRYENPFYHRTGATAGLFWQLP